MVWYGIFMYIFFLSYSVELDGVFNITNLFNFVSSSVVICTVGFLCIVSDQINEVLKFAFCFLTLTLQIYTVCWMGDRIIESVCLRWVGNSTRKLNLIHFQSTSISNGVYNSQWYECATVYQKNLILIIMRSHRAQTMTAYKFSYASRKTFSSVSNGTLGIEYLF